VAVCQVLFRWRAGTLFQQPRFLAKGPRGPGDVDGNAWKLQVPTAQVGSPDSMPVRFNQTAQRSERAAIDRNTACLCSNLRENSRKTVYAYVQVRCLKCVTAPGLPIFQEAEIENAHVPFPCCKSLRCEWTDPMQRCWACCFPSCPPELGPWLSGVVGPREDAAAL